MKPIKTYQILAKPCGIAPLERLWAGDSKFYTAAIELNKDKTQIKSMYLPPTLQAFYAGWYWGGRFITLYSSEAEAQRMVKLIEAAFLGTLKVVEYETGMVTRKARKKSKPLTKERRLEPDL